MLIILWQLHFPDTTNSKICTKYGKIKKNIFFWKIQS